MPISASTSARAAEVAGKSWATPPDRMRLRGIGNHHRCEGPRHRCRGGRRAHHRFRRHSGFAAGRARPAGPALTAADVLRMATIEGAAALGMNRRIGSLRPGKQATS
ncbi:amidohydrolase family protein [Microbispora sp. H13382]|uniref:amidohydrolase family protein n=1 Tax=Microbispora sp. H13382 TaxID=2729112 RepID=UPI0037CB5D3B